MDKLSEPMEATERSVGEWVVKAYPKDATGRIKREVYKTYAGAQWRINDWSNDPSHRANYGVGMLNKVRVRNQ